jgi:hypothetical protein
MVMQFLGAKSPRKRAAPLSERMVVRNGAMGACFRVSEGDGAGGWCLSWRQISNYSHAEGHFWNSDAILLAIRGSNQTLAIPTEARGAREFFEALVRKCPRPAQTGRTGPK